MRRYWVWLIIGGLLLWMLIPRPSPTPQEPKRRETRAVLSPDNFVGRVRQVYALVQQNPELIDQIYCYCHCWKSFGHKSLLTCFVTTHGADCDICLYQAEMTVQLSEKGWSIPEIRGFFAERFGPIPAGWA